jgi:hypothetical protein
MREHNISKNNVGKQKKNKRLLLFLFATRSIKSIALPQSVKVKQEFSKSSNKLNEN